MKIMPREISKFRKFAKIKPREISKFRKFAKIKPREMRQKAIRENLALQPFKVRPIVQYLTF